MGTWNVKTLLKPGKMQELAEELAKTQLEIVAIQETRWPGTGHIKKRLLNILQWNQRSKRSGGQWLYSFRENWGERHWV
jgi:hypothetical protein